MFFSAAGESNENHVWFSFQNTQCIFSNAVILHLFYLSNPFISLITDADEGKKIKKKVCLSLEPNVQKSCASQY